MFLRRKEGWGGMSLPGARRSHRWQAYLFGNGLYTVQTNGTNKRTVLLRGYEALVAIGRCKSGTSDMELKAL